MVNNKIGTKKIIENMVNNGVVVCINDLKEDEEFGGLGKAEYTIDYEVARILKEHKDWRKYKIIERTYLTTWKTWYEIRCGLDNLLGKLYPIVTELEDAENEVAENKSLDSEPLDSKSLRSEPTDELLELKNRQDINEEETEEVELGDYNYEEYES